MTRASLMLCLIAILVAPVAQAAIRPQIIPSEWELKIKVQDVQSVRVRIPGAKAPETFWYILYTVTNQTGKDQTFIPSFTLYTDTGQALRGDSGSSPKIFGAIQARHNNPLLKNGTGVTGKLLQGADNAKDGVAIFRNIDPKARKFDLFVGGLSGETAVETLPVKVKVVQYDLKGVKTTIETDRIVLQKMLQLAYAIPGEAGARPGMRLRAGKRTWVMR